MARDQSAHIGRSATGAAARYRLLRRALASISPLESALVYANTESMETPPATQDEPRSDIIITASDLQIRIVALPGSDAATLDAPSSITTAMAVLLRHPEASAVVLIADDEELTARLVEPTDSPSAIVVQGQRPAAPGGDPRRGSVRSVIGSYLSQVNPGWTDASPIHIGHIDLDPLAREIAQSETTSLRSVRRNRPESRAARLSIDAADADWAADLAVRAHRVEGVDVIDELQGYVRRRR